MRNLSAGRWIALDATQSAGGQTQTGGTENANRLSTGRVGLTFSLPIGDRHSLKPYGSRGILTRTGTDLDTLGVVWQYCWGGGR